MEIPIENALDKLSIGQTIEAIDATPNIQRCLPRNIPIQKITLVQDLIESPKSNRSHTSTPDEEKNKSVSSICSHSPIPISTPTEEEKHERVTSTHSDSPIPQTADSKLNIKYYSFHIDKRSSLGKLREKKKSTSILKLTKVQSFKKNIHPLYFGDRPPTEYVVSQRDRFFRNQDNIFNSKIRSSASKWPIRLSTHSSNSISKSNIISGSGKLSFTNEVQTGLKKEESAKFDTEDSALSFLIPEASNYRIEMGTLIGQGGYGKVYHGIICDTNTHIAIKVAPLKEIKPKGNSRSNRISRSPQGNGPHKAAKKAAAALEREMLLLSGLEHENIVKFIGFDTFEGSHHVYLEYVSGGTIASGINLYGQFDEVITQSLISQVLDGLVYLHNKKIVHRDIKGANVLVTTDGIAKISDFGLSKKHKNKAYHMMSRNSVVGSIPWVAPEAARGHVFTAKVDVWSCGCLVLEMLTGKLPWSQVGGASLFHIGNGNAPPIPPTLSDIAASFLEAAFELDPNKRPTASEARQHPFAAIDRTKIDFRKWAEEATTRYRALNPLDVEFLKSNSTPDISSSFSSLDSLIYDKGTSSNASSVPSVNMLTNDNSILLVPAHLTTSEKISNTSKSLQTSFNHRLKNITKDFESSSEGAEGMGHIIDVDDCDRTENRIDDSVKGAGCGNILEGMHPRVAGIGAKNAKDGIELSAEGDASTANGII